MMRTTIDTRPVSKDLRAHYPLAHAVYGRRKAWPGIPFVDWPAVTMVMAAFDLTYLSSLSRLWIGWLRLYSPHLISTGLRQELFCVLLKPTSSSWQPSSTLSSPHTYPSSPIITPSLVQWATIRHRRLQLAPINVLPRWILCRWRPVLLPSYNWQQRSLAISTVSNMQRRNRRSLRLKHSTSAACLPAYATGWKLYDLTIHGLSRLGC